MMYKNVASNFWKSGQATKWYLRPNLEASFLTFMGPCIVRIF